MGLRNAWRGVVGIVLTAGMLTPAGALSPAAADPGGAAALGARTAVASAPRMASTVRPRVTGQARFGRTLRATTGRWTRPPRTTRFQWFRGNQPIPGARSQRYGVRPEDVGRRLSVRVTAHRPGAGSASARSRWSRPVAHRVGVRRTVTYRVETRGRITTSLQEFRRQAQQTFDDPRGWRASGVRFVPVARGGDFSLVLAAPGEVPRFSPVCSSQWSCRVGRHVIINQVRWRTASPAWNRGGGSLRGYRHMVVNHETGHWLGRGHVGCPGRGRLAPVMMQQSKDLGGCRFNPWPTTGELRR